MQCLRRQIIWVLSWCTSQYASRFFTCL